MTSSHRIFCVVLSTVLAGCSQEVGFAAIDKEPAEPDTGFLADTAEPEPEEEPLEDEPTSEDEPLEQEEPETTPEDDCDHTSDLIYVIDQDSETLYLFQPETLSLSRVGALDCDMWVSPESMGVARDGYAYVRYSDESVYQVDLESLDCRLTDYNDRRTRFGSFGMGYATDSSDTWRDQLYVANEDDLAKLNTTSWEMDTLGALSSQAELTGNAEGELWAFLPLETPAELVHLNKDNASPVETLRLPDFPDPYSIDTFAFATWGGDFWLFVRTSGMGNSTDVYQVTPAGEMTLAVSNIGINVVGAGVSTCAPTD